MSIKFPCPSCGQNIHVSTTEPMTITTTINPAPVATVGRDVEVTNIVTQIPRSKSVPSAPSVREGVVIHHSGTAMSAGGSNPKAYARYHVEDKDWPSIGYHFVIQPDGSAFQTLNLSDKGYHAGDVNSTHFGVCFSGDFDREDVPPAALEAGARLVVKILHESTRRSADPARRLIKHSDVASKTCPGTRFPWAKFTARVNELTGY